MVADQPRYSPLIYEYLRRFQEDPKSRVFAPLAEAYRKAGLVDEAIEIAREGLREHPRFIGGRVALARALFDKKDFGAVIDELSPVVQDVPDNLVAQRLLGESCLMVGRVAEALAAYKMLLYYAPGDPDTARVVEELEAQAYDRGTLVLRTDPAPVEDFTVQEASTAIDDSPAAKKARWIRKVERLQAMLGQVARYRSELSSRNPVVARPPGAW